MTKYSIISESIKDNILSGVYAKTHKLPSIRDLSFTFDCSKGTIIKALETLSSSGFIYAVPQSGHYVLYKPPFEETKHEQILDLSQNAPNSSYFPYEDFKLCLDQAISKDREALFQYGTQSGYPALIQALKPFLESYQVYGKTDQICICSGVQQALVILCQMDFPNGKRKILIEEPSYHLMIQTLKVLDANVLTVPRLNKALDLEAIEYIFKNEAVKCFYLTPRIQNPLGISLSEADKKALVQLARQYDVYLIEDDYMADFETNAKSQTLHYYDVSEKVIYLKSFSKIMFPGLRVGVAVLPSSLVKAFTVRKQLYDIDSSMFSQAALEIYIRSGMFLAHRDGIRKSYDNKGKLFVEHMRLAGLENWLADTDVKGAKTHLVLPIAFPPVQFINHLLKKGIKLEGLESHYYHMTTLENRIKMDLTNCHIDFIPKVVEQIKCIAEEMKRAL